MSLSVLLSPILVLTLLLMVATGALLYFRFAGRPESNWPLLYYAGAAYLIQFEGVLPPHYFCLGLGIALLLRFEFLGRIPFRLLQVAESGFLLWVLWRCQGVVLWW